MMRATRAVLLYTQVDHSDNWSLRQALLFTTAHDDSLWGGSSYQRGSTVQQQRSQNLPLV